MEYVMIKTTRLLIRHLKPEDLEDFYLYRSNPEVTRYQGFDVMSTGEAQRFIATQQGKSYGRPGEWVQYGIELAATGRLIGDCAIKLDADEPGTAEAGITISHLHQQQGYAKEALLGIMRFLFDDKGIRRMVETVDAENAASIRLLHAAGFRREGHFIEHIFFKGQWGSEYQYALLKREWEALREGGQIPAGSMAL